MRRTCFRICSGIPTQFLTLRNLRLTFIFIFFSTALTLQAQDVQVDEEELSKFGDQSIQFINYVGPYEFTNTLDQIRNIGLGLGKGMKPDESASRNIAAKYSVKHIVSPQITEGLDADILILGDEALVDHIDNLRAIIAGYIEAVYQLSARQAYLLAEFVTYYNAVYRGDIQTITERYKAPVVAELDADRVGLDVHYYNWPGLSEILIPLRGYSSGVGVDVSVISDDEVIDAMREEQDKGLDSRRGLVELREDKINEEQKDLDRRRLENEEKQEAVDKELEGLQDKEQSGEPVSSGDQRRKEELEKQKSSIEKEEAAIDREQKDLDERTDDVLEMRDEIAEDKNTIIQDSENAKDIFTSARPVWFLAVDDEGNGIPFGRVVKYDLDNGRQMAVSQVTAVRGRTMVILPDSVLVIAGKEDERSRVRLTLLDKDSLETIREGSDEVFPGSLMTLNGTDIYLVTEQNGQWRLGRFAPDLTRQAVSEVEVAPWTAVFVDGSSVYAQGEGGVHKLSAQSLKEQQLLE